MSDGVSIERRPTGRRGSVVRRTLTHSPAAARSILTPESTAFPAALNLLIAPRPRRALCPRGRCSFPKVAARCLFIALTENHENERLSRTLRSAPSARGRGSALSSIERRPGLERPRARLACRIASSGRHREPPRATAPRVKRRPAETPGTRKTHLVTLCGHPRPAARGPAEAVRPPVASVGDAKLLSLLAASEVRR